MQYKGVVLAWHQKVLRPAIMPIRGEKFDKLNLVQQAGVMLAYSVIAGQLIGRTKEAIQNAKQEQPLYIAFLHSL
jgi:hypothetical protein